MLFDRLKTAKSLLYGLTGLNSSQLLVKRVERDRVDIWRDHWDRRSRKIIVSCVNSEGNNAKTKSKVIVQINLINVV